MFFLSTHNNKIYDVLWHQKADECMGIVFAVVKNHHNNIDIHCYCEKKLFLWYFNRFKIRLRTRPSAIIFFPFNSMHEITLTETKWKIENLIKNSSIVFIRFQNKTFKNCLFNARFCLIHRLIVNKIQFRIHPESY